MSTPTTSRLIMLTGHSATGKTVLSRKIGERYQLLCINKDAIKERLADCLGVEDREASKRIGRATYEIMDYWIEQELRAGHSLIIESNFPAEFYTPKLQRLQNKYPFTFLQILCKADPEILLQRVVQRIQNGQRHPAHQEQVDVDSGEFRRRLGDGRIAPIELKGCLYEIETSNFATIDYTTLYAFIDKWLAQPLEHAGHLW